MQIFCGYGMYLIFILFILHLLLINTINATFIDVSQDFIIREYGGKKKKINLSLIVGSPLSGVTSSTLALLLKPQSQ